MTDITTASVMALVSGENPPLIAFSRTRKVPKVITQKTKIPTNVIPTTAPPPGLGGA
jgi:hypothetical protein